ncbi:MAG: ASKHA domain-containing protein [Actinobacteria bacterium]|nr:ASKHA domain-containing protein [Actinomycetota bacterium]
MSGKINFEPIGKRFEFNGSTTIFEAAKKAGVGISSICGGKQTCGKCRVKVESKTVTPISDQEKKLLTRHEIEEGYRLACSATVSSDAEVYIPQSSLTGSQKLGILGQEKKLEIDPVLSRFNVRPVPATLEDLRSDFLRIKDSLYEQHGTGIDLKIDEKAMLELATVLRDNSWDVDVIIRGNEVISVTPASPERSIYGIAVDIGTTKVAIFLVDLFSGKTIASDGFLNPQIDHGEDVMSRLLVSMSERNGSKVLKDEIVNSLNAGIKKICKENGIRSQDVCEIVCVGNTAMHHLFLSLQVRQLALSPFVPVVDEPIEIKARDVGVRINPGAYLYMPSVVAGFVGADHIAMLLASDIDVENQSIMAIDIGTNTEIALIQNGRITSCSTASGPAFEGAHIKYGMRASEGAIERINIDPISYNVTYFTIGDKPPVGICGSGVLDAVAEMVSAGIIDERGKLLPDKPGVRKGDDGVHEFVIAKKDGKKITEDIVLTQKDIVAIQLAKGAIRTGINVLCEQLKVEHCDLDKVIIAGAFGLYIDPSSAIKIGMFPDIPLDRFEQVGNAAGVGAKMMLVSKKSRDRAREIAQRIEYVELTIVDDFATRFAYSLLF